MLSDVSRRWRVIALVVSAILFVTSLCLGLVHTMGQGTWPADWPKELEPYRKQARTIGVTTGNQEDVFEISFPNHEEFEKIWPVILTLKSEGAPLTLTTAGSAPGWAGLFDNSKPIVRIYAPSYTSYTTGPTTTPDGKTPKPSSPWPESAKLPNGQLPKYVVLSDDKTTWVPADANHNALKGFEFRARIEIELVVDGNIIDLNRIRLPAKTPIVDKREFGN